jgi:hypothetical protein
MFQSSKINTFLVGLDPESTYLNISVFSGKKFPAIEIEIGLEII